MKGAQVLRGLLWSAGELVCGRASVKGLCVFGFPFEHIAGCDGGRDRLLELQEHVREVPGYASTQTWNEVGGERGRWFGGSGGLRRRR